MMVRLSLVFCAVVSASEIVGADNCQSNLVVHSEESNDFFVEVIPVTNVTEVGWEILSTLEGSIDAHCALLVYLLRQHSEKSINKEDCQKKMIEADLYGNLFKRDVENAFRVARVLKEEVFIHAELELAVSASVILNGDKKRNELRERSTILTSPPSPTMRKDWDRDYKWWMNGKERYNHMLLCAYFKSVLMRVFLNHVGQNVKMDDTVLDGMRFVKRSIRDQDVLPSNDDIDFVFYVVTNQTAKYLEVLKENPKGEQGNASH